MASQQNAPTPQIAPQTIVEICLCHHARRAARSFTRIFDEAFAPLDLKASQFNILVMIAAHEAGSAAEIARRLALDPTTLSRNLKPLREAGYVTAEGGAGRRPSALALTVTGQGLLHEAIGRWQAAQSLLSQRLGGGQAGALLQALEAAVRAAEK